MYNRYIPNSDGSHIRKPFPQQNPVREHPPKPPEQSQTPPQKPAASPPPVQQPPEPVTGFLRNLLPKEFDTGDLLIVLLLLLMASDYEEKRPNALLTLALYFFMQD